MPFDIHQAGDLLNELPEALFITTLRGEIIYVNRALENLTGFANTELIGQPLGKLMPDPARRRARVMDWLSRWAEDPNRDQLRYLNLEAVTSSGEIKLVSVRVSRHRSGDETWFLVVMRDVTSQHETAAAMRHAQLVTNRILAIGEDAILSIDTGHRITYCNPRGSKMFGYTQEELLGQNLNVLLPPELAKRHEKLISDFSAGTEASRLMGERGEVTGRRKDGSLLPLEISITKTSIDGETVLSAQIRDISLRKQAQDALRDSEAMFRAIFEHALEAMALLTPRGRLLEINNAGRQLLPEVRDNALFWDLDWWGGTPDEAALQAARAQLRANVEKCAAGNVVRTRASITGHDATSREIDFSLIPVDPAGEGVVYILAEGRDITPVV